jgi:hypothetical protein
MYEAATILRWVCLLRWGYSVPVQPGLDPRRFARVAALCGTVVVASAVVDGFSLPDFKNTDAVPVEDRLEPPLSGDAGVSMDNARTAAATVTGTEGWGGSEAVEAALPDLSQMLSPETGDFATTPSAGCSNRRKQFATDAGGYAPGLVAGRAASPLRVPAPPEILTSRPERAQAGTNSKTVSLRAEPVRRAPRGGAWSRYFAHKPRIDL